METGRPIGQSFAEFLSAMQFLGGKTNEEMGTEIGLVNPKHYDGWVAGDVMPHDYFQHQIRKIFALTVDEASMLRSGMIAERERRRGLPVDVAQKFL